MDDANTRRMMEYCGHNFYASTDWWFVEDADVTTVGGNEAVDVSRATLIIESMILVEMNIGKSS